MAGRASTVGGDGVPRVAPGVVVHAVLYQYIEQPTQNCSGAEGSPCKRCSVQIKDGSMWNKMAAPHKPPPRYMAGSVVSALPDMATVHLDTAEVQTEEKEVPQVSEKQLVKGLDSAMHGADQVCATGGSSLVCARCHMPI